MILKVPFTYRGVVKRKGRRLAEEVTLEAVTTVQVRELTGDDAPVAVRIASFDGKPGFELRWFEGRLLRGVPGDDAGKAVVAALPRGTRHPKAPEGPLEGHPDIAHVLSHDKADCEDTIKAAALAVAVIDGKVWCRTSEPYVTLRYSYDHAVTYVGTHVRDHVRSDSHDAADTFRLDEIHLMATARPEPFEGKDAASILPGHEVLIPESIRLPLPEYAMAEGARSILERLQEGIKSADVDYFVAYRDLRDALADFEAVLAKDIRPDATRLFGAMEAGVVAERLRDPDTYASWRLDEPVAHAKARIVREGDADFLFDMAP